MSRRAKGVRISGYGHFRNLGKGQESFKNDILRDVFKTEIRHRPTEFYVHLLRLFADGEIEILGAYFEREQNGRWEFHSADEPNRHPNRRRFSLTPGAAQEASRFLAAVQIPITPAYLDLAFSNLNLSYTVNEQHLAFLSAMMGLEILFNAGQSELRYRVSRSCAMLLARDRNRFRDDFRELKDLYDKRSKLVHAGDTDQIHYGDLIKARTYLRRSLLKAIELGVDKLELCERLDTLGFRPTALS